MQNFTGHLFLILIQLILCFSAASASDKHIILKAKTGNIILEGKLIGYDATHYRINSPLYGPMTVFIRKFSCIGEACPNEKDISTSRKSTQSSQAQEIRFTISGSSLTGLGLVPELLEQFAREQNYLLKRIPGPNKMKFKIELTAKGKVRKAVIDINANGSSPGFSSLIAEQSQIVMSTRPAQAYEADLAKRTDPSNKLIAHKIGLDAIAIITSPRNKINSLSMQQVAKIFAGEIRDWSEVGGRAGSINIYLRNHNSGIHESFSKLAMKPFNKDITRKARKFRSSKTLSETLSTDPRGIGFTELTYAENAKTLFIKKNCGQEKAPNTFNIKTQEYPYTRNLYLYSSNYTTNSLARKFLNYSQSEKAQTIINSAGFVNQSVGYQSFDSIGNSVLATFSELRQTNERVLLKSLVRSLRHSNRLSVIFRFQPNSIRLDATSVKQISKLGPVLQKANQTGKKVYLAGFSDSAGDFEQNREIALLRAQQVKNILSNTLKDFAPSSLLTPVSFGELLPVACNTTPMGRAKNRRVEIWITK
ncbi:MAG: phosphate ABC transporter substrate-binding/OmpA family protein [Methyloligellaceae bacterium]